MNTLATLRGFSNWIKNDSKGFFITLNSLQKDHIAFESNLRFMGHRLNDFCYGRAYKRREKSLKIIAAIENGRINNGLHSHLMIIHGGDVRRSIQELNFYTRKQWYSKINQGSVFGSMVNVQDIGDLTSRFTYITKDTTYLMRDNNFNILVI